MSAQVLAHFGRQQITECSMWRAEGAPEEDQPPRILEDFVGSVFKETDDANRPKWSLIRYDDAGADFPEKFCDAWVKETKRRVLIVRCARKIYVFMHKPDQQKCDFQIAAVGPSALYTLPNPNNRHRAQQALLETFSALQEKATVLMRSMRLETLEAADVNEVFEETKSMTEEQLHMETWQAKQLSPAERCPTRKALCTGHCHLIKVRALERKRLEKEQRLAGIVCRPGSPGATQLCYPRDLPGFAGKQGITWCEKERSDVNIDFARYMDTKMHFEKVLVLWGKAGLGKSPAARCIANYLAFSYGTHYLVAASPEALKDARQDFDRMVPVILEEMAAGDVSQHGKKLSPGYLKHLFNVRDGGQCSVRHVSLNFHPLMPRIMCINDAPAQWLKAVDGITDDHEQPLKKRLFFVEVDKLVLDKRAIEVHEEELDMLVLEGKRRRIHQNYGECCESTTAEGCSTPRSLSSTDRISHSSVDDDAVGETEDQNGSQVSSEPLDAATELETTSTTVDLDSTTDRALRKRRPKTETASPKKRRRRKTKTLKKFAQKVPGAFLRTLSEAMRAAAEAMEPKK